MILLRDRPDFIPKKEHINATGALYIDIYNKCNAVLDFHHVNSKDKKFSLQCAAMNRSPSNIITEVNKCILLCSNCHREIHHRRKKL